MKKILMGALALMTLYSCSSLTPESNRTTETVTNPTTGQVEKKVSLEYLNEVTPGWPEASQKAASDMIKKYGVPTEKHPTQLIWRYAQPFKRIVVYREEVPHNFPVLHQNVLEHVVNYKVNPSKFEEIMEFDEAIVINRNRGELSSFSNKESLNIIALNLTHEISTGHKSTDAARLELGREYMQDLNGSTGTFSQALIFGAQLNTWDPGQSIANRINWTPVSPAAKPAASSRKSTSSTRQSQEQRPASKTR
jgi:hypothetical protein